MFAILEVVGSRTTVEDPDFGTELGNSFKDQTLFCHLDRILIEYGSPRRKFPAL